MNVLASPYCSLVTALALSVSFGHSATASEAASRSIAPAMETAHSFGHVATDSQAGWRTTAPAIATPHLDEGLLIYLADPELGLAGRYSQDGQTLYFQARSELDLAKGVTQLRLHIVDGEARTVAVTAQPPSGHEKTSSGIPLKGASRLPAALAGLSAALESLRLHPALSGEKAGLAVLAGEAATRSPMSYPMQLDAVQLKSADTDTDALVDFYQRSVANIRLKRASDGMLIASLGGKIRFESAQFFRADEENEGGGVGRIDVYSRLLDSKGMNLGAEFGGDYVPDGWEDVLAIDPPLPERSHDEIAADMGAGAMRLNALALGAKSSYGVAFSDTLELDAMYRMARSLSENLLPRRDDMKGAARDQMMTKSDTGLYRTQVKIYRKGLVSSLIAQHSATRIYKHQFLSSTSSSYTVEGHIDFCNHGGCPMDSNMSWKCTQNGPRETFYRVPQTRWADGLRHTCSTDYGLIANYRHNCHDDSSVQVRAVKGLSYSHDGGRCSDTTFWSYAPDC